MADIVCFHHAQGLTPGLHELADRFREAGHRVHQPDLYEGQVFADLGAGVEHGESIGFAEIVARGVRAAEPVAAPVVVGLSMGVLPAMRVAMSRDDVRAAVLLHACVAPDQLGGTWPAQLPTQVHGMDADPEFADAGDLAAARALAEASEHVRVYTYPGDAHLFTDPSLPAYDDLAAGQVVDRILTLLDSLDTPGGPTP